MPFDERDMFGDPHDLFYDPKLDQSQTRRIPSRNRQVPTGPKRSRSPWVKFVLCIFAIFVITGASIAYVGLRWLNSGEVPALKAGPQPILVKSAGGTVFARIYPERS